LRSLFPRNPLRAQFPRLQKVSQDFTKWLSQFDLVFSQKDKNASEWQYYLEAGIQNFHEKVFALPKAFAGLRRGQYFVHRRASEGRLDTLCKSLRLRGCQTNPAE
jgi:hypothetical protein